MHLVLLKLIYIIGNENKEIEANVARVFIGLVSLFNIDFHLTTLFFMHIFLNFTTNVLKTDILLCFFLSYLLSCLLSVIFSFFCYLFMYLFILALTVKDHKKLSW